MWRGHGQEAKIRWADRHRITRNLKRLGRSPPTCGHRGVPCRGVVPERRHASGAAVDACHGTTAWARRAERVADGSVVDVPRALAVPPRAPCINAQRANMAKTSVTWMRKLLDLTSRRYSKPCGRLVWPLWSFSPRHLGKFWAQNKILLFPHWRYACPGQVSARVPLFPEQWRRVGPEAKLT